MVEGRVEPNEAQQGARRYRYTLAGQAITTPRLAAGLYLVATPIGNLRDITLRALEMLAGADLVACEDTRVTRKLFDHYGLATPLMSYHEHNAEAARPRILEKIAAGNAVALVSDAGTPLISDPGYKLLRAVTAAGLAVTAAPGASAALMALTVSGLPTDRFFFEGFLPPKDGQRRTRIAELANIAATLILYESGPRIGRTLGALAEGLGSRPAAICRELTKLHEEVRRGELAALALAYDEGDGEVRGEFTIVIAPPPAGAGQADAGEVDALLRRALQHASVKDAVSGVAAATGRPRREIYQRALALGEGQENAQESEDGATE